MGKKWITRVGLVLALGGCAYACRANSTASDTAGPGAAAKVGSTCAPGRAGCPCALEGSVANCGSIVSRHGDYVHCSEGTSTCQGGVWGACSGTTLVTKSLSSATLGPGGLRILSTTTECPNDAAPQCQDPCDPNVYTVTVGGPEDIDATGIVATADGGITLAAACEDLSRQVALDCPSGVTTTLVGTVRDPAGVNPVYNATVYIASDACGPLPPLQSGAACGTCDSAPPINALAAAQTGPDGTFTLTNVPSTDVAPGSAIPLVVALGKWRREVLLTSVPKCQTTTVDPNSSRLPHNQFDGAGGHADIPKMAIAAAADPIECLLLRMGVDPAEFQKPGAGTRRIDYYSSGDLASLAGDLPDGGPPPQLMNYDAVLLPCEAKEDDTNALYSDNVAAYANAGGRLYTSHFGYTWFTTPVNGSANAFNPSTGQRNPFYGVAKWTLQPVAAPYATNASISTTLPVAQPFTKGQAFATWAQLVGASPSPGVLPIGQAHADVASVNPPTTMWIQEPAPSVQPLFFSFDTPFGSSGAGADSGPASCGRVEYSEFHVPKVTPVTECTSNADCGFTATCLQGTVGTCAPVTCTTTADCASGYTCGGATPGMCTAQTCTADWQCDTLQCVQGTCACTNESQCKSGSCTGGKCLPSTQGCTSDFQCGSVERCTGATQSSCQKSCSTNGDCTQGELCASGMCQGCYDPSDCPSMNCMGGVAPQCSASSSSFPLMCKQGPFSPEEDAIEFMLLDLTSCISPDALPPPPPSVSDAGTDAAPFDAAIDAADGGTVDSGFAGVSYSAATFTVDFTSSCPQGTHAVWRELDWNGSIPNGTSIVFSAQTANVPADGGLPDYSAVMSVQLATAIATPPPPGAATPIDTGTTGAFNIATPPVISRDALRLTVTLNPTTDGSTAPTLLEWQVKADCLPSE